MKRIFLAILFSLFVTCAYAGCTIGALPFNLTNGTTADASQVMANFNQIANGINIGSCAGSGNNTDITSLLGTTTGVNALPGQIGELIQSVNLSNNTTVTFTNGQANIAWAANTPSLGQTVYFTNSGGALPTNFSANTNYYVTSVVGTNVQVSATYNGTAISAGSAGTGTQTGHNGATEATSAINRDILGVTLTAGDWTCSGVVTAGNLGGTTEYLYGWLNTTANTPPTALGANGYALAPVSTVANSGALAVGEIDYDSASTTTVYLGAQAVFSSGGPAGLNGSLRCRRVR
jgi:hypothetical protein